MFELLLFIGIILLIVKAMRASASPQSSSNKNLPPLNRWLLANILEDLATKPEYSKERNAYLELALALREGRDPLPSSSNRPAKPVKVVEEAKLEKLPIVDKKPFEMLENINVLLFSGAFLVVVSVAILVGANYEAFSDLTKMLLVVAFSVIFYSLGLWLYKQPKFQPAGITFTAIGMITLPLLGVAYRNFISPEIDPALLWFVVGLVSASAYALTTRFISHQVVYYALILAIITTVDSGLLSLDAPVYVLAWTGLVMAGLMLVIAKLRGKSVDNLTSSPLTVLPALLAPFSVLYSLLLLAQQDDYRQLAITALLSGLFFLEMAIYLNNRRLSKVTLGIGLLGISASPLLLMQHLQTSRLDIAILSLILSAVWCLLNLAPIGRWLRQRKGVFMYTSVILAACSVLIWPAKDNFWLPLALIATIYILAHFIARRSPYLWGALLSLLALPSAIFVLDSGSSATARDINLSAGLAYSVLRLSLAGWKYVVYRRQKPDLNNLSNPPEALVATYWIAFGLAYIHFLLIGDTTTTVNLMLLMIGGSLALSYLDRLPKIQVLSQLLILIFLLSAPNAYDLNIEALTLVTFYSAMSYVVAYSLEFSDVSKNTSIWRISAMVGLALGALNHREGGAIVSSGSLATTLFLEAYLQKNYTIAYFSAFLYTITINWWLVFLGISEVYLFSLIWTALFTVLAYFQYHRKLSSDPYIFWALVSFTIPLGMKALDSTELWYAFALVMHAVILILIGLQLGKKLIWRWGLIALITEVLYQSRDVIAAIPKQFISLGLGIAILSLSIYYLQKRDKD